MNDPPKLTREVPLPSRHAAKQIQAKRLELRKGVHRQVRFRQQAKAGNPAGLRKLMPLDLTDWAKIQVLDDLLEQSAQRRKITQ